MTNATTTSSRTVILALVEQGLARRGAAASAESLAGLSVLNQSMIAVLRSRHAAIERRRAELAQLDQIEITRQAYATSFAA
jgi:hypothetical protein